MATKSATEQHVKIAAQLYEARSAMRGLLGGAYAERMAEWSRLIRLVMEKEQKEAIPAMLVLAKQQDGEPIVTLLLMAATVEVIESKGA